MTKKIFISFLIILSILLTSCSNVSTEPPANDTTYQHTKDEHTDTDANGYCDGCGDYVIITLDLYTINDLHGKFVDTTQNKGVGGLTTFLKASSAIDDVAIFLSSGDMWQGGAESNLTHGNIVTDWMNELDFVSMTLGNHEFDWGEEFIKQNAELAEFPILAINVYSKETNERVDYCASSVLVERGDLTIGIIGAIGDCYSSISSDKTTEIYFKTGNALTELVKEESNYLKSLGADVIVYSVHDGYDRSNSNASNISSSSISSYYSEELSRDGYVDVVFEGHTHKSYVLRDSYGVYHLQGGGDNNGFSHVELDVNYVNDTVDVNTAEHVSLSSYSSLPKDPIIDGLLEKYNDQIDQASDVLGRNAYSKNSNEICDLVSRLYAELGEKTWGDEYDIVLGGGFLQLRSPYNLRAGEIKYADLLSILPFDNQIVLGKIKGSDLKSKFLYTSNSSYHISLTDYGKSIENSIDNNAYYYIIVDTYTSQYAYNRIEEIARFDETTFARDLLAEYIKLGGLE